MSSYSEIYEGFSRLAESAPRQTVERVTEASEPGVLQEDAARSLVAVVAQRMRGIAADERSLTQEAYHEQTQRAAPAPAPAPVRGYATLEEEAKDPKAGVFRALEMCKGALAGHKGGDAELYKQVAAQISKARGLLK